MKNKSVSVIIPYYNAEGTIKRAIESVIKQTVPALEIIIVDDKSKISSLKQLEYIIHKYKQHNIALYKLSVNSGAGEARNFGMKKARGELIAFLDSDDSWHPQKIELQSQYFTDEELYLCGHKYNLLDNYKDIDGNISIEKKCSTIVTKKQQLLRNRFATSTVMIRNTQEFYFYNNKRYSEDFLLWSEIICAGKKSIKLNISLTVYYKQIFGENGLSSNLNAMYKGAVESYYILYKKGFLRQFEYYIYKGLAFIKHLRRLIIVSRRGN